jgi:hypothetical protein
MPPTSPPPTAARAQPSRTGLRDAAVISLAHTLLAGAVAWFWLGLIGAERGVVELMLCAAPAVVALGLGLTSQQDRRQYVVRLLACSAMLPLLLMMWAGSQEAAAAAPPSASAWAWMARPGLFFSLCAVVHALVFVATVWWLAAAVTRVEAAAGAARVGAALLCQRVQSLGAAGVPMAVSADVQGPLRRLRIQLPAAPGRRHLVLLEIDDAAGQVLVRERLGAAGAAPEDANEASLRSVGDAAFDPARPDAQQVYGRSIQTTMIEPEQLAAVRIDFDAAAAQLHGMPPSEPEAIVTLLCALVTRSGYAWQPVLGRQR